MFVCPECGSSSQGPGTCAADGAGMAPIGDDLLLGATIGAYRIARLLGIGGMGRVYKGVHPTIGSRVAIKVLSRECTDRRELVDRFFAEAKAVNLIRHESIVNILDLATLPDGRPYIIMEYLDGAPLASIIEHAVGSGQALPLGGVARLAVEVLDALGAAHAKGIIHRDLKPDNIFVTPSGRPKVLDFGIAKLNDATTGASATRTGSLLGTPHYMSPEQASGKPVEQRADIYAMGVILFECVTGQKPFVADSLFELLRQQVEVPAPSPRTLRPDIGGDLEAVILTALAKAPDQRFASAQAMSVALQHATAQLAPEQWTPITGSGTHRAVPSGAWQPTPPASWGSGATHASRGSRPPASGQPPQPVGERAGAAGPQHRAGHPSTVSASAGQLQKAPTRVTKEPARKAVWIALGATLLVGGGVTAAIVASRGDGDDRVTSAKESENEPPAEPPPVVVADIAAAKGTGSAQPAGGDTPVKPEAKGEAKPEAKSEAKSEAKGEAKSEAKGEVKTEPKAHGEPADAGAKSGKQPPVQVAEADDPPPKPATGGAPIWDDSYSLPAFKFDKTKLDGQRFLAFAISEAKKADPGAVLTRIDMDSVAPDGTVNLTLPSMASPHSSVDLRFVSMERGKRDPSLPVGTPHREKQSCEFRIEIDPGGAQARTIFPAIVEAASCIKQKPVKAPRCSLAQVWAKAIAKGAPATNAVAGLGYRSNGRAVWYFDIGEPGSKIFSDVFNDDC